MVVSHFSVIKKKQERGKKKKKKNTERKKVKEGTNRETIYKIVKKNDTAMKFNKILASFLSYFLFKTT